MNGKVVLSYFIGAAVGCLVTGYLTKKYYKRVADEEIESMKDVMKKRVDKFCEEKFEEKIDDIFEEKTVEEEEDKPSASAEPVNYAAKYRGGGEVNDILDGLHPTDDGQIAGVSKKKNKKKKGARIIKVDNFDADPQYRKMHVYYYLGDDVVADEYDDDILRGEDDRELGKVVDYVPLEVINKFGFKDNDEEGVIYIRNEDIMYDFEVIKDFGTYADIRREE